MIEETIFKLRLPAGEYRDVLRDRQGKIFWQREWQPNVVVNGLSNLLAALVMGDSRGQRLMYWAVGSGEDSWDEEPWPSDEDRRSRVALYNETGRQEILPAQMTFIDAGGNPQTAIGNRLQIAAEFAVPPFPAGPLREFGLFSGSDGTNPSILIDHAIHPRIDLQEGFTLQRTLRLTF
jgi:hypothetical protein